MIPCLLTSYQSCYMTLTLFSILENPAVIENPSHSIPIEMDGIQVMWFNKIWSKIQHQDLNFVFVSSNPKYHYDYGYVFGCVAGCDQPVSLAPIGSDSTCHLYSFCTGVTCCSDLPQLQRSFNTWLILDHCNFKLSVGIEQFSLNISLHDFKFGRKEMVNLNGVFRLQ